MYLTEHDMFVVIVVLVILWAGKIARNVIESINVKATNIKGADKQINQILQG